MIRRSCTVTSIHLLYTCKVYLYIYYFFISVVVQLDWVTTIFFLVKIYTQSKHIRAKQPVHYIIERACAIKPKALDAPRTRPNIMVRGEGRNIINPPAPENSTVPVDGCYKNAPNFVNSSTLLSFETFCTRRSDIDWTLMIVYPNTTYHKSR